MSASFVSVTHNGITRDVRCSRGQYTGTEYALQRTSRTTPFLRQVELFSGVSFRSQAINDDRTIQRIAGGIRDLQGFNEEDRENFRKQIILTSIDFDSGELRIVEKNSKNANKSRDRKERTVKELWASVVEEEDGLEDPAPEITEYLDMAYPRSESAKDGEKEDTLKTMRKTLHCLEEIEEIIKQLREKVNTSEEVNSEELKAESKKLLEAIQSFINFKKAMLAIIDAKHFPVMDVENLKHSLKPNMNLEEILKVWKIIESMYNESKIKAIRRWLLKNVVFRYIVLLFDNSKSMTIKNKDNTAIKFAKQFIEYSNQGTDSTAIAVIHFGGGPNLLEKLTLLERFDATSLDKIKFEGCTPLATALISCKRYVEEFKEKICSTLNLDNNNLSTNTDCVMVTDSLPTELHNDFLSGNVSSPKDECQKFSKTYEKKDNIFRPEHKGYVLDIASMDNAYPVLADYYLHQKYISEMETIHKVTKHYLAQGKIIRGDDHPRAEIYQQLGREWEINTGTNILTLSDPDNKIINIYLTELKTSRSKVLKLHLDGKWRICRIIPRTETRGISNIEDTSKHEAYDIKITSDSGELYPAELIRKRRVIQ
ncbi:uncharacterized protein LOC128188025 isoform X3 [Crassostrea angulata]|uniref:uncharacterized protein LOC128188025 isoform X3 n=1 Tax=Magallana angulata TaxID=2784310 RepID=UPI0022B1417B|nr:uncharacterized protein LOC128188025 isoform X3 [Crassostrea angulata]